MNQTQKLIGLLVFLFIGTSNLQAQAPTRMTLQGYTLVYSGNEINLSQAKQISKQYSVESFESFKKAKRMENWNYVWSFLGGYELGAGIYQVVFNSNALGFADIAIGGVLVSIPYWEGRRDTQLMYAKQGVKKFNEAITSR